MNCSFQLTLRWCTLTYRTNVYCNWFLVHQGIGCQHVETELVKVVQLKYPTISYMNKLYEGNKKTLFTQTFYHKMLKLLCKIKIFFCLWQATNLASLGKLLQSYFVTIIRTLQTSFNKRIDTYEQENPIFRVIGSEYCKKYCQKIFQEKLIIISYYSY